MKPTKVVVPVAGGLGNQLFILASGLALARANDRDLVLDFSWFNGRQRAAFLNDYRRQPEILKFPNISASFSLQNTGPLTIKQQLSRARAGVMKRLAVDLDSLTTIPLLGKRRWVRGLMLKPHWFSQYRPELQRLLSIQDHGKSQDYLELLQRRKSGGRVIAVHVRRGDSVVQGNLNPVLRPEYFRSVVNALGIEDRQVVVFSDSPKWCATQEAFQGWHVADEPRPHVALWLMSQADDFVLSPSTFGWWAAWLFDSPEKRVIVPVPFQPASPNQWRDLIMPGWITHPGNFVLESTGA